MPFYEIDGLRPVVHSTAFVHPDAVLIGDVIVGAHCYVAPLASLRGDFGRIILEAGANLQDTCVMHGFPGTDTVIEENGHVGHGAVLHGCRIGCNALIGMNAVIMDNVVVGADAFIAACAFVKAGMEIPPGHLATGVPAKVLRPLSEQELKWKVEGTHTYHQLTERCLASLQPCEPLAEMEEGRRRLAFDGVVPLVEVKARHP